MTDFVSDLYEEDLRWLKDMLTERIDDDVPKAINFMSQCPSMDEVMASAETAWSFYETIDRIRDAVLKEDKRRATSARW